MTTTTAATTATTTTTASTATGTEATTTASTATGTEATAPAAATTSAARARTARTAISINRLTKSYGDKEVLRGLDLTVPAGSVLALLGPNGAGKTTTVEILQGLRRRDGGAVSVLGHDPQRSSRSWRARIGVVSQASTDMGDLTVTEAVSHVARFYGDPADVAGTVERVGLADDAGTRASRLSGGRRRRLDVALAIVGRPELLFLDEPTTGFDPKARRVFWNLVEDLRADGTTVLLTTHYLDEAAHLADEVAVVLGGSIAAQGAPEDLARGEGDLTVSWVEDGEERSVRTTAPTAVVRGLMSRLAGPGEEVPGLRITAPTLEDRYLELVAAYEAAARRAALTAAA